MRTTVSVEAGGVGALHCNSADRAVISDICGACTDDSCSIINWTSSSSSATLDDSSPSSYDDAVLCALVMDVAFSVDAVPLVGCCCWYCCCCWCCWWSDDAVGRRTPFVSDLRGTADCGTEAAKNKNKM